ncbi:MAG: translation initiation factor IF-2 [Bacillota bacterium]|nr:translation initiation factor IF-2 [Bacillota bacterium]
MSKVRINDLARELEVKSKAILDVLPEIGVTEKKTHSSSLEADEAERVRAHFQRGGNKAGTAASKTEAEPKPKIDWSRVSKPGDVLKAIQQRKEQEEASARSAAAKPAAAPVPPPQPKPAPPAPQQPAAAKPSTPAPAPTVAAAPPAPRKIVPQPRPAPAVIAPPPPAQQSPAIAAKPPAGPVVAKPPVPASGTEMKPAIATPPPAAPVAVKPPAAPTIPTPAPVSGPAPAPVVREVQAPAAASAPAAPVTPAAPSTSSAPSAPAASSAPAAPAAPTPPAAPARRVIMPQTGPRPVYTAPPQAAATIAGGLQRGKPIFDRRPATTQRPLQQQYPGGRRPMHPTRSQPGGGAPGGPRPGFGQRPGGRPGMGAPALIPPPPGEAPRGQRPGGPQRRGRQEYEIKEGPMKGFAPPRIGAAQVPSGPVPITRTITVTEGISVKDLAEKLEIRAKDLIATLLMRGVFVTVNQSLDTELVKDVARQFGADTQVISFEEQMANEALESMLQQENPDELEVPRPPVVTVMGHVDHGKTSLLDAIRETDVAGGEAGGITQHIGAYKVRIGKQDSPAFGREIVFLDTPGHEAFTRMRARGAKVTDIVVVVVAADDGVMPQTLEAIDHARAANVPIIVAVNKIDKPEAQPERVKKQLADRGLVPEDWGGSTVFVEVSAKKHQNLDLLLEMICLVADLQNLKATPGRSAVGTVIEAKLDRGRGAVASVLVQNGTLRHQDSFIVGNTFGKVRAMFDDRGRAVEEAGPSTPVEILGLEGIPDAGDTFLVVSDRDKAKSIAQYRKMKEREAQLAKSSRVSLEGLAEQIRQAGVKELPIILKGDVQGSVEVLADSLQKMSTEKVRIKVIRSGVGAITESDVLLASASNAIIIGFNVRPERKAADLAEQESVEIRLHSIIYELQDEIRKAMLGLLEPVFKENYLGRAEVLNVFKIPKVGTIAGCRVTDGVLRRDADIRLMRDGEQVYKGKLTSLKRFKDDVREVTNGMECGVGLNFGDIKVGDTVEAFITEKVAAELTAS